MATLLAITANPQAFASGNWPATAMNGARWRFSFTFTYSSASGQYAGYHALFTAPNGGNSGGLWIAGGDLEFYNLANSLLVTRTLTWSAGATVTFDFDMVAKTIAISGATTGNGVAPWSGGGPYFNGSDTLTAGGLVGQPGYAIAGTFSNIDDGVNSIAVDAAAVTITAAAVGLRLDRRLAVDAASVAVTAMDVGLRFARRVVIDAATTTLMPGDIGSRTPIPPAVVTVTAHDISLRIDRQLTLAPVTAAIAANPIGGSFSDADPITKLEDAIFGWIVAGSGLDEDHVIWGRDSAKNGPMPSGTYISMRLKGLGRVCNDWMLTEEVDGEIVHRIVGPRQVTLELTCFSGEPFGAGRAQLVLDRALASIRRPSVAELLRAGGVGVGRRERIRVVDGSRSGMLDPRAIVEVGLHVMIELSEQGYAIERAPVTVETPETGAVATWVPEAPA